MTTRRIAVITGTRAEYGLLKPVLERIRQEPSLHLDLIVTGMHLAPEYGYTVRDIEADGMPIAGRVEMQLAGDTTAAMAKGMGLGLYGLTHELERLQPDITLVLGDRVEAFAGAVAGLFCASVVAHIHGGELTQGGLDEYMRHAITKLSHVHFTATEQSARRVRQMGESADCVFCTGAPGLDALLGIEPISREALGRALSITLPEPYALIALHPVSTHPQTAGDEIRAVLQAVKAKNIHGIVIYPNADAGSRAMIEIIDRSASEAWLTAFKSVPREGFVNLMRHAAVLVGNTSAGMLDAPSLGLPVINVGERQEGRERGENVIDVSPKQNEIEQALDTAFTDAAFLQRCCQARNPYGDGRASQRIVTTLISLNLDQVKPKRFSMINEH